MFLVKLFFLNFTSSRIFKFISNLKLKYLQCRHKKNWGDIRCFNVLHYIALYLYYVVHVKYLPSFKIWRPEKFLIYSVNTLIQNLVILLNRLEKKKKIVFLIFIYLRIYIVNIQMFKKFIVSISIFYCIIKFIFELIHINN